MAYCTVLAPEVSPERVTVKVKFLVELLPSVVVTLFTASVGAGGGGGGVTTPWTWTPCENSDVSPNGAVSVRVAVAVMNCPAAVVEGKAALKLALPTASATTPTEPTYVLPSPKPLGSSTSLA